MAYAQTKLGLSHAVVGCLLVCAHPQSTVAQQPCGADSTALTYHVTDRNSRLPLPGVSVRATWSAPIARMVAAQTDSAGRARLCLPRQQAVTLRAAYHQHYTATPITLTPTAASATQSVVIDVPALLVRGRVIDQQTGAPVAQAVVRMSRTAFSTLTDGEGRFHFASIPIGDYQLQVDHLAYASAGTPMMLRTDDLDALVRLTPAAIPLQPIVVTAFSRRLEQVGFYERQKRGVGTFISRKQIEAMSVHNASDLLRSSPSLRLIPQPRRANNQVRGRRGNCRFVYIVDGARTLMDFEMDNIAAHAIEGVELYNGLAEVPAPFRAHAGTDGGSVTVCGVIAIWTRNSR